MKAGIMKRVVFIIITICMAAMFTACGNSSGSQEEQTKQTEQEDEMETKQAKLLYMGHASIRITTPEDKVIYIDPFAGEGYEPAADLILVTHDHYDHRSS